MCGTHEIVIYQYFHNSEFIWAFFSYKTVKLVYLPPVLVPKRVLMPPMITRMDTFVMLIHVWYIQNSYLSVFSQFRIFWSFFSWITIKLVYLPPVLVPKRVPMTLRNLRMDNFVMLIHVWYTRNSYLSVFSQFRIYLGLFLLKHR